MKTLQQMTTPALISLKEETHAAFVCVDASWRRTLMADPRFGALDESRHALRRQWHRIDDELWSRGA